MTGIDVSSYQEAVDWGRVKKDGISFAMIRLGFRGYQTGSLNLDRFYQRNIKESQQAGIPRGVYFFSTAVNPAEARTEADWVSRHLEGQSIELPVAFDYEYITNDKKYRTAGIRKKERSDIAVAFLNRISENGFSPMMYASENGFRVNWDTSRILSSTGARVWLARYYRNTGVPNPTPPSGRAWDIWQYTSKGKVDGVAGPCDVNRVKTPFWETSPAEPPVSFLYRVEKGDVPERLAARFGITPGALLAANKEKYPAITIHFIRTGWELIIPAVPEGRTVRVKALIGLNVREGPGTGYQKRGALSYGTRVRLLASAGDWGKIDYQGKPGYIALAYTKNA